MTSRDQFQSAPSPYPQHDDDEISLLDLLLVLVRRKKLILFTTLLCTLGAIGFSIIRTPATPPPAEKHGGSEIAYRATVRFLPPVRRMITFVEPERRTNGFPVLSVATLLPKIDATDWNAVLYGPKVRDNLRERFSPDIPEIVPSEETGSSKKKGSDDGRELLSVGLLTIQPEDEEDVLCFTVEHEDRFQAAEIANAYVEELEREISAALRRNTSAVRLQLAAELESARKRLSLSETAIQAYRERNGTTSIRVHESRFSALSPESATSLQDVPENFEYAALLREWRFLRDLYSVLQWNHEEARMNEAHGRAEIQVLESATPETAEPAATARDATPPAAPQSRRSFFVVLGAFLGFFLSVFMAFMAEFWKKASEDPEQSEKVRELRESLGITRLFSREKKPPKKR